MSRSGGPSTATVAIAAVAVALALGVRHGLRAGSVEQVNGASLFLNRGNFRPVQHEVYATTTVRGKGAAVDDSGKSSGGVAVVDNETAAPEVWAGAGGTDEAKSDVHASARSSRDGTTTDRLRVVSGRIPEDLRGAFLRIGPNQRVKPEGYAHWFDGDGMVHAVTMMDTDGTDEAAVELSYANHWVRTARLREDARTGRAISPGIGSFLGLRGVFSLLRFAYNAATGARKLEPGGQTTDPTAPSNTAMIFHDRRLMALVESASPFVFRLLQDGHLESIGLHTYGGKLKHPFTAHPKLEPRSGQLSFFGYSLLRAPLLSYAVVDSDGELIRSFEVKMKDNVPMLAHDFAITENYAILYDVPLTLRLSRLLTGGSGFQAETRPFRFGILPRLAKSGDEVVWFEAKPGYTFHTMNAWEETAGDGSTEIVLVLAWYEDIWMTFGFGAGPDMADLPSVEKARRVEHTDVPVLKAVLREYRFNLASGEVVSERTLPGSQNAYCEFPGVNPKFVGQKTRYGYIATTLDDPARPAHVFGVAKVDLEDDGRIVGAIEYGDGKYGGEPVFVPRPGGTAEDDGYLLTFVHDESGVTGTQEGTGSSYGTDMWVMDAKTMDRVPLAVVRTPQRVPYGFHGLYITPEQVRAQRTDPPAMRSRL